MECAYRNPASCVRSFSIFFSLGHNTSMKRPVIFLVLFLISFSCLSSLRADESFRIHERRWKEVYSAKGQNNAVSVLTFPQIRSLINSVKQGKPGNVSPGSTIEFRGFFKPETENSFRITEDDYAVSEFCDSCKKSSS